VRGLDVQPHRSRDLGAIALEGHRDVRHREADLAPLGPSLRLDAVHRLDGAADRVVPLADVAVAGSRFEKGRAALLREVLVLGPSTGGKGCGQYRDEQSRVAHAPFPLMRKVRYLPVSPA